MRASEDYTETERPTVQSLANFASTPDHSLKNPFNKEVLLKVHHESKDDSDTFMPRCPSLYKSKLKNKVWHMDKLPIINDCNDDIPMPEDDFCAVPKPEALSSKDIKMPSSETLDEEKREEERGKELQPEKTLLESEFKLISTLGRVKKADIDGRQICLRSKRAVKTLLLDLDETIIRCTNEPPDSGPSAHCSMVTVSSSVGTYRVYVQIRPHFKSFLKSLYELYDIVVFSSASREYVEAIVYGLLDPARHYIHEILTRTQCVPNGCCLTKDLRVICNRRLQDIVIVDNSIVAFCAQISNGIPIRAYDGSPYDNLLLSLLHYLKQLATVPDVRVLNRRTFHLYDLYKEYLSHLSVAKPKGTQAALHH